jgi:hypothetical protein
MSTQYNEQFEISRFIGCESNILEELYKERMPADIGGLEDFLKLPVNEEYAKNQELKKLVVIKEDDGQEPDKKEDDDLLKPECSER